MLDGRTGTTGRLSWFLRAQSQYLVVVARKPRRLVVTFTVVLAGATLATGEATPGEVKPAGEIVERAAQRTAEGTSRVRLRFDFADSRRLGFAAAGVRDYRDRRGYLTMWTDFQTNQFMLRTLRRWLAQPRLTQAQARALRFDIAFGGGASRLRIRASPSHGRVPWRTVARPTQQEFIFSSLAAVDAEPVRIVRWLRSISSRVVVPAYGRNVQVRGIDTTQYDFQVDRAKAAVALLPFFPMDQSREATLAQLRDEIGRKRIRISASVWVDRDGRLRRISQRYEFPEPERRIQQATISSDLELFEYGTRFYQPPVRERLTRRVPPFPGLATTWNDLERILAGQTRTS
jgi:hypothetical protein